MRLRDRGDGIKGHFCICRYNENDEEWEYYNFGKWCSSRHTSPSLVAEIFFTEEHAAIVMKELVYAQMIAEGRVLTCVYCGMAYPQDTPAHGDTVLTDHIRICPKHPLRAAEEKIKLLRSALVSLVGTEDEDELGGMVAFTLQAAATGNVPRKECTAMIDAIGAIRETKEDRTSCAPEAPHGKAAEQSQTATNSAIRQCPYQVCARFADNGALSHYELIESATGVVVWSQPE